MQVFIIKKKYFRVIPWLNCKENMFNYSFQEVETAYIGLEPPLPFANSDVFKANILYWRRLTALDKACKDVYEVTFDIQVQTKVVAVIVSTSIL